MTRSTPKPTGRVNQKLRTRKDILAAAAQLLKTGGSGTPDMDRIAAAANVSRATAYRYFPTIESLLIEAPLDGEMPTPEGVFAGDRSTDAAERIDKVESAVHRMVCRNQSQLRIMLAASLERSAKGDPAAGDGAPLRQNRRSPLIEAALEPIRGGLRGRAYQDLCAALALVIGVESMIVLQDVLGLDEKAARRVKSWAVKALVEAAINERGK